MGAGVRTNNYSVGDTNFDEVMGCLDDTRRGYHQVTLTNMSTAGSLPAVAAGSMVEVNGAMYEFTTDSTLTATVSTTYVAYIKVIPTSSQCTVAMTTTAPTWSDAKQGWYGTSTSATERYLHFWVTHLTSTTWNKYKTGPDNCRICPLIYLSYSTATLATTIYNDELSEISTASGSGVVTLKYGGIYSLYTESTAYPTQYVQYEAAGTSFTYSTLTRTNFIITKIG